MSRVGAISHAAARELGWTRVDPRPWSKLNARWSHVDGWTLEHCGHPTALRPWMLYNAAGSRVLTGAQYATPPDPTKGYAWPTLLEAMTLVAGMAIVARLAEEPCDHGPQPFCPREVARETLAAVMR